jgi:adenylate cyclase
MRKIKVSRMEAPPLERRLAAILAADVEGYSRLMHNDEEATLATLSARRSVLDELIVRYKGRIANTAGDSVLAEFASALDAVRCAVEIQEAVAQANEGEPEARQMHFRIGINVGDVMVKQGDIFGDGVNVAARLEGLARSGEICVSRGVRDHLRRRPGMVFEDLGEQLVKNIAHPIRAFRLRIAENTSGEEPANTTEIIDEPEIAAASAPISELSPDTEAALELALWESVKDGAAAEVESYLERYPEGTFASLARTRLEAAAQVPEALSEPEVASSDLSADSEAALELAFWESVKDGTAAELESYLEKYPEGTFASLARTRLADAERSGEPTADAAAAADELDLAFWDSVKDSCRREELQAYLDQHPNGHFAALARLRLASPEVN